MALLFNGSERDSWLYNSNERAIQYNGAERWTAAPENYLVYNDKVIKGLPSVWVLDSVAFGTITEVDNSTTNIIYNGANGTNRPVYELAYVDIPSSATKIYIKYSLIVNGAVDGTRYFYALPSNSNFTNKLVAGQNQTTYIDIGSLSYFDSIGVRLYTKNTSSDNYTVQLKIHEMWYE